MNVTADEETERLFAYYLLGREFGWTPNVIDEQEKVFVDDIMMLIGEINKVEAQRMKANARH